MIDSELVARARDDIDVFARLLVGEPLWGHQLKLARSEARIRVVCSGRQAGKSRVLSVISLHEAFRAPDRRVLLVSAGESAARDLLAECSRLCAAPLLAGSVVDDNSSVITLSNGSQIRSVPASQRQIRGQAVDLLVVDEGCFVPHEVWTAARWTTIARPGSRILLASTPWGRQDGWFAVAFRAGERRAEGHEAWTWPSTASPLVDRRLLEIWREQSTDREYAAEVEARWVDDAGSYFSHDELAGAVVDLDLPDMRSASALRLDLGLDWGRRRDATAVVGVGWLADQEHPVVAQRGAVRCPLLIEEWYGLPFQQAIDRVVGIGSHRDGVRFGRVVSEQNGIGEMPTEELRRHLVGRGLAASVDGVFTDARSKESSFGAVRLLLQRGELVLPRHRGLLKQLAALEYDTTETGSVRIAVPERAGHDDVAMALSLAIRPSVGDAVAWAVPQPFGVGSWRLADRYGRGGGRAGAVMEPADPVLQQRIAGVYQRQGHEPEDALRLAGRVLDVLSSKQRARR